MTKPRILILGAGERVKQDLLPVLFSLGYQGPELLLLRKSDKQISEFPQYKCIKFDGTTLLDFNPNVVISCLPTGDTLGVIHEVLSFTSPNNLFVDTPISKISSELILLRIPGGVHILEDNHLVFFSNQFILPKNEPKVIFVLKALYDYHGVALLSKVFGKTSKRYLKFKIRNFLLLVFKSGSKLVIWVGPRNYSLGNIYFLKMKGGGCTFQKYNFSTKSAPEWTRRFLLENLDSLFAEQILSSSPIRNMLFWKRMALGEYMGRFLMDGENRFLTLEEAIENERYF